MISEKKLRNRVQSYCFYLKCANFFVIFVHFYHKKELFSCINEKKIVTLRAFCAIFVSKKRKKCDG